MPDSIDSLDSTTSDYTYDDEEEEELRLAQQEWEESLEQLQQLVAVVLLPFLGKFLGRRWSHWGTYIAIQYTHLIRIRSHPVPWQPMLAISGLVSESLSSSARGLSWGPCDHSKSMPYTRALK